jgi:hypothetical protein
MPNTGQGTQLVEEASFHLTSDVVDAFHSTLLPPDNTPEDVPVTPAAYIDLLGHLQRQNLNISGSFLVEFRSQLDYPPKCDF